MSTDSDRIYAMCDKLIEVLQEENDARVGASAMLHLLISHTDSSKEEWFKEIETYWERYHSKACNGELK